MKRFALAMGVLAAGLATGVCSAGPGKSELPLSVESVRTQRVKDVLVRVIEHLTVFEPRLDVEVIATPKLRLLDRLEVRSAAVGGEKLVFKDAALVEFSEIQIQDEVVQFRVSYDFRQPSGRWVLDCRVKLAGAHLAAPTCARNEAAEP